MRRRWPDTRLVWVAAAAVATVLVAVLAVELLRPREVYTGTNAAGSSGPAQHVEPGHTLCVGGLDVPSGTGRLRLRLAPLGDTDVRYAASARGAAPATGVLHVPSTGGPQGSTPVRLDVPVGPAFRGAAQVCVTPSGPIDVAGRPERFAGQAAPTLDGRPAGGVAAVWYLPPAGERHSVLSQLPDIVHRAALFRPGIVGPWTYWLLLLVVPPLVGGAAVLLIARAVRRGEIRARTALHVAALAFVAAASWSLLTPVLNAPDELEHVAYAQAIAEQGRAPSAGPSERRAYSTEAQAAYEGARLAAQVRQADGRPPWTQDYERDWERRERALHARGDDGAGWTTVADYTPAYYAAVAPAYLAASGWSFWSKVTAMRLLTALMVAAAAAFTVLLVRELLPRPGWPAVVAGLFVALQPMVSFIGGMVNNDAPVIALSACALWLVARGLRRGLTPATAIALGAVAVAAPMAKGSGLFLLPPIALGLLGIYRRHRGPREGLTPVMVARVAGGAAAAIVAFVVLAAALHHAADPTAPGWYASTGNAYPTLPGKAVAPSQAFHEPAKFAEYLWQMVLPPLPGMDDVRPGGVRAPAFTAYVERGWGAFAFAVVLFPKWVYVLICLVIAGLIALGIRLAATARAAVRSLGWELGVLAFTIACVVLGTELAYFEPNGASVPEFGRYLFPAAAAFATLATGALFGAGRRGAIALGAGLATAMAVLWWSGLWLTAAQLYT